MAANLNMRGQNTGSIGIQGRNSFYARSPRIAGGHEHLGLFPSRHSALRALERWRKHREEMVGAVAALARLSA